MNKFVFIVIVVILLLPSRTQSISLEAEDIEAYGFAGAMSYLSQSQPQPQPLACECDRSSGKISYDGGTSFTDCQCENGECGCRASGASEANTDVDRLPRVVLVTNLRTCPPCIRLDRDVTQRLKDPDYKASGWIVSSKNSATYQTLDTGSKEEMDIARSLGLSYNSTPTFFYLTSRGVTKTFSGYMSLRDFLKWQK